MSKILGIDLGTTNSAIARTGPDGRPQVLAGMAGEPTTPSVVLFASGTEHVVGEGARREARLDPEHGSHLLRSTEAETAEPELFGQGFEVHCRVFLGHDQDEPVVLVAQKEVLRMGSRNRPTQGLRLFDREHGVVFDGRGRNSKRVQIRKELRAC